MKAWLICSLGIKKPALTQRTFKWTHIYIRKEKEKVLVAKVTRVEKECLLLFSFYWLVGK
jgi:hypothetical protein